MSAETEPSSNETAGNCKVILLIITVVVILGGGIGVGVYFAVSAILTEVSGATGAKLNATDVARGNDDPVYKDDNGLFNRGLNDTGPDGKNPIVTKRLRATQETTTGASTTTTLPPVSHIPRQLLSCDRNHTIEQPWSWSVKIIYRARYQVEVANRTYHTNELFEYEDIAEELEWLESEMFCGGTIINNHYIITSGKCCKDIAKSLTPVPRILLGSDQFVRTAQNMTVHPLYQLGIKEDGAAVRNDLCLIRIEKDLFYSGSEKLNTEQVCLPEYSDHVNAGVLCWTGGYGSLASHTQSEIRTLSNIDEVEVIIMADKYCRRSALSSSGFIWNEHFCADFLRKDPAKACSGDLGGALICIENNQPVIFGVTSLADHCGEEDNPAVYTKLSQYTQWIEQIIS